MLVIKRLTASLSLSSWSLSSSSSSSSSSSELLLCWYRRLFVQPSHLPLPLKLASLVSIILRKGEREPGLQYNTLLICARAARTIPRHAPLPRHSPDSWSPGRVTFHISVNVPPPSKHSLAQWFRYHGYGVNGPGFTTRSQSSECFNLEK